MNLVCPCCHAYFPVEAGLDDVEFRRALATALRLPGTLGDRLIRYLRLFNPPKRALAPDRASRLLEDLLVMVQAGEVIRKGRSWPVPYSCWEAALDSMLDGRDRLSLPLKSHGYLLEIVIGLADKGEAKIETSEERDRSGPYRPIQPVQREMTDEEVERGRAVLRDALAKIAGGTKDQ